MDAKGTSELTENEKKEIENKKIKINNKQKAVQEKIKIKLKKSKIDRALLSEQYSDTSVPKDKNTLKITAEYNYVLNGFSTYLTEKEAEEIKKLPEIKNVYQMPKSELDLFESPQVINADDAWALTDAWGKSIDGIGTTIAMIDTGIDYTHPMFGSCTRARFIAGTCPKFAGGLDFVNNDNDPMDDHGHGTITGSIAAGYRTSVSYAGTTRSVVGIAPGARLYVYKAYDSSGLGTASNVIRAIDHAVSINNDGNTANDIDVISLSASFKCGKPYTTNCGPEDVLAQAVTRAVESRKESSQYGNGIIVVVSAGNCGPTGSATECGVRLGEESIRTPGTAKDALTVGSTNKQDQISTFSSRGPVIWNVDSSTPNRIMIKPDIVAPGENIFTALHNNRYALSSGVSNAAPHVSGVAALVRQAHPEFNARNIKAVVVSGANEIIMPINQRGYGRLDALTASGWIGGFPPTVNIETNLILACAVCGNINIRGTATGSINKQFVFWTLLQSSVNGLPPWTTLAKSYTPKENVALIRAYDTSKLSDGDNFFKLSVKNYKNRYIDSFAIIRVCRNPPYTKCKY